MSTGAALTGALLTTLATPATWPLALAAFLVRGGFLAVALPIVVLPSPVGLGNLLAPTLMEVVFQGPSVGIVLLVGAIALLFVAWIVVGGLLAATLEAESARIVERDEGIDSPHVSSQAAVADVRRHGEARRILAARLAAHLPTSLVVSWGSARVVAVAYRELTTPVDVATPITLRVLSGVPEVVVAIGLIWMLGEIVGAIAARRIVLDGVGVLPALRDALVGTARHPVAVLGRFWLPSLVLALVLVISALATSTIWGATRVAMRANVDPFVAAATVLLFVGVLVVGLLLIGVTSAWRAAVWSVAHGDLLARHNRTPDRASG